MFDYLIVGCGFAGSVCARTLAERNKKILIIDKRNHIGGNAYDYYNASGIMVHKYGPHIFHTENKRVWDFVSRFTKWNDYQHRVLSYVDGKMMPFPINVDTINILYGTRYDSQTIDGFYKSLKNENMDIKNSKDMIVSKVGETLYEKFFRGYTKKQWDLYPEELDKEVTARIPIRFDRDDRYFINKYQGMPLQGYTRLFENMLDHKNIKIMLNTDYFEIKDEVNYQNLIYTGPIDYFFNYCFGNLPYRSLEFVQETYNMECYQKVGTVNYPNDYDFTRITEYKYLTRQKSPVTTIMKEYSKSEGDPYYPIPKKENNALYRRYEKESQELDNTYFIGRLANYKYFNMDAVINDALSLVDKIK
ncbi:UDP-galactopyranose mutase [Clostridium tyrobutyricum]|uniref:UDP-galactopyranose mutase n=1 Tax=Clostridium tyrobutyricum TaxID=1519 RepID=UPI001C38101F|nr:UDP-galactopyranose mutase [Clostridium tyrobutyricum]MBV4428303.1 UDP-galactopyranose mutase [Clostridium tyrobutyricum]MBV4443293.1 UDP-galactopyranose mutase [Clostridium tyrobutyricum]